MIGNNNKETITGSYEFISKTIKFYEEKGYQVTILKVEIKIEKRELAQNLMEKFNGK